MGEWKERKLAKEWHLSLNGYTVYLFRRDGEWSMQICPIDKSEYKLDVACRDLDEAKHSAILQASKLTHQESMRLGELADRLLDMAITGNY